MVSGALEGVAAVFSGLDFGFGAGLASDVDAGLVVVLALAMGAETTGFSACGAVALAGGWDAGLGAG